MITSQLRPGDPFGRWDGEEFVIAAPNTSLKDGVQLAERICRFISASDYPIVRPITISAGIAAWTNALSVEEALRAADHALCLAKANGRNRIETAGDLQFLRPSDPQGPVANFR